MGRAYLLGICNGSRRVEGELRAGFHPLAKAAGRVGPLTGPARSVDTRRRRHVECPRRCKRSTRHSKPTFAQYFPQSIGFRQRADDRLSLPGPRSPYPPRRMPWYKRGSRCEAIRPSRQREKLPSIRHRFARGRDPRLRIRLHLGKFIQNHTTSSTHSRKSLTCVTPDWVVQTVSSRRERAVLFQFGSPGIHPTSATGPSEGAPTLRVSSNRSHKEPAADLHPVADRQSGLRRRS